MAVLFVLTPIGLAGCAERATIAREIDALQAAPWIAHRADTPLARTIRDGLAASPEIAQALANERAALARVREFEQRGTTLGFGVRLGTDSAASGAGLLAEIPLYDGGRADASRQASRLAAQAATVDVTARVDDVLAAMVATHVRVAGARSVALAVRTAVARVEGPFGRAGRLARAGLEAAGPVADLEISRRALAVLVARADTAVVAAEGRYRALVGRAPEAQLGTELPPDAAESGPVPEARTVAAERLRGFAERARADLEAAGADPTIALGLGPITGLSGGPIGLAGSLFTALLPLLGDRERAFARAEAALSVGAARAAGAEARVITDLMAQIDAREAFARNRADRERVQTEVDLLNAAIARSARLASERQGLAIEAARSAQRLADAEGQLALLDADAVSRRWALAGAERRLRDLFQVTR